MAVNLPLAKHQRHREDVSVGDNSDRISNLPDEILVQILCHLPTKEAVATGILSKRWEYLWASTSNLDFSDAFLTAYHNETDRELKSFIFKQFVDRVIFFHGISSSILRKCTMTFHTKYIASHIYPWIYGVISHCNIKELELTDNSFTAQHLPFTLFTCKSLVVLKIKGIFVLDLPPCVCLPSLKDLNLSYVRLADDYSARRLLSSCPVLERLSLVGKGDSVKDVEISIPSLKSLIIDSADYSCWFTIDTPGLQYLFHRAVSRHTFVKQSSLIRGKFDGNFNILLLSAMSQVRVLTLGKSCIQHPSMRNWEAMPTFSNLKVLKINVGCDFDWKVLLKFLKFTPKLWALSFPRGLVRVRTDRQGFDRFNVNWNGPELEPECLSSKVKIIYVNNLVGFEEELRLVRYLVECCKVLEEMKIWRSKPRIENLVEWEWENIKSEVLKFERGSDKCQIVFVE